MFRFKGTDTRHDPNLSTRTRLLRTLRFRIHYPTRYLTELAGVRLRRVCGSLGGASVPQVIRLLIVSDHREFTSEQQFAPFLADRKLLHREFGLVFDYRLLDDVLSRSSQYLQRHDLLFLKISFRTPREDVRSIVRALDERRGTAKLVYFDGDDDLGIQWPEILPHVDLYVKKHVFRNFANYRRTYIGKSNLTDYVSHRWGVSFADDPIRRSGPVDASQLHKLFLSYNLALNSRIRDIYRQQPVSKRIPKEIDVVCRASVHKDSWQYHLRRQIAPCLSTLPSDIKVLLPVGEVPAEQYFDELRRSRICVSPFGYGEICGRDFEAILMRSLLIKPDMSHVRTIPNIYSAGETYVPVHWEFQDLEEKCRYFLEHEAERVRIVEKAYRVLADFYEQNGFVAAVAQMLARLGMRGEPPAADCLSADVPFRAR